MSDSLRRRLERLETRPLNRDQIIVAMRLHKEKGEMPKNPRLRDLIEKWVATLAAMDEATMGESA